MFIQAFRTLQHFSKSLSIDSAQIQKAVGTEYLRDNFEEWKNGEISI
jgi:hypothetical protein